MKGQRVRSRFEIVPDDWTQPIICPVGMCGTITQVSGRFVVVRFDNGNSCDCVLKELELVA